MATVEGDLTAALTAWFTSRAIPLGTPAVAPFRSEVTVAEASAGGAVTNVDELVVTMFREQGRSLVRLARLFVDDRNAAEDLVQEAFIRLARSAHRIVDVHRAPAYLRSIVLNLVRDENRRGLVSLRHRLPITAESRAIDDAVELRDDQRAVIAALRQLSARQRTCLVLRYYDELAPAEIASNLGISPNSVKTHLQRGLANLESVLAFDSSAVGAS